MIGNWNYGTGRRKSAVARVFIKAGKGDIIVNDKPIGEYFSRETSLMIVRQPLELTSHVSTFDIKVLRASPALLPFVNLVGNRCTTAQPVSVTMSGTADLTGSSTFTGTYTIPKFKTCQGLTLALDVAISGPGNTFTATATPQS